MVGKNRTKAAGCEKEAEKKPAANASSKKRSGQETKEKKKSFGPSNGASDF
jgi:hypothetical protein